MVRRWKALPACEKLLLHNLASPNDAEAMAAAPIAHKLSTGSAADMSGRDRSLFTMHTNRNVSHHSGWLSVQLRWKFLRANPRGEIKVMGLKEVRARKGLQKGQARKAKVIKLQVMKRYSVVLCRHKLHLAACRALAVFTRGVKSTPPAVCLRGYIMRVGLARRLAKLIQGAGALKDPTSYLFRWLVRGIFIGEMRAAGIESLRVNADLPVKELADAFPDQGEWVENVADALGATTVRGLIKALGYRRPVEFLTMDWCLFNDSLLQSVPLETLVANASRIKRESAKQPAHVPAKVVAAVCAGQPCGSAAPRGSRPARQS